MELIIVILIVIFVTFPLFWSIVFGFIFHPLWFIVAIVVWMLKD